MYKNCLLTDWQIHLERLIEPLNNVYSIAASAFMKIIFWNIAI